MPAIGTRFGTRGLSISPHRRRSTTTAGQCPTEWWAFRVEPRCWVPAVRSALVMVAPRGWSLPISPLSVIPLLFYAPGSIRRPTNSRVPVSWWTMAHRKGRSATIVRSGSGGMDSSKSRAVAAAASVPFSSTISLALWSAAVMNMPGAMPSKGASGQKPSGQSHANRPVGRWVRPAPAARPHQYECWLPRWGRW